MAESILLNQGNFKGLFGDNCDIEFSTNQVSTTIIQGLTATKTADKICWVNGPLTYTITVKNETDSDFTSGIMTDYLDPSIVMLDNTYDIFINGAPTAYTFTAGVLSVALPTIAAGDTVTITFRIMQV